MTVRSDLLKAVASAEAAKGTYLMAAQSTEDSSAQSEYEQMASDIDMHIEYLNSRIEYLASSTGYKG
ncbi:MAG: DUF1657 domain-containing protein [Syntrophomonadaceae bacterium]|nr:DUF1657 domain-containing protein [Syntrophomonadaceae bacterium]